MRPRRRPVCGPMMQPTSCQQPIKEIVYPVQNQFVQQCSEEIVKHIHPIHTTVVNHHIIKNEQLYPHTTSVENTYEEVEIFGAGMGNNRPSQVAGAGSPGFGKQQPFTQRHGSKKGKYKK